MPAARLESTPSLTMVDSGLPTDTFNVVCATRLRSSELPEVEGRVVEHFRSAARPLSWWVAPGDEPADLAKRLIEAGLEEQETELAMSLDLAIRAPEPGLPDGVEIREATARDDVAAFARINAENWDPPDPARVSSTAAAGLPSRAATKQASAAGASVYRSFGFREFGLIKELELSCS